MGTSQRISECCVGCMRVHCVPSLSLAHCAGEHGAQGQKLAMEEGSFLLDSNSMFRWGYCMVLHNPCRTVWLASPCTLPQKAQICDTH